MNYDQWKSTEPRTITDLIERLPDDIEWPDDDQDYSDFLERVDSVPDDINE